MAADLLFKWGQSFTSSRFHFWYFIFILLTLCDVLQATSSHIDVIFFFFLNFNLSDWCVWQEAIFYSATCPAIFLDKTHFPVLGLLYCWSVFSSVVEKCV